MSQGQSGPGRRGDNAAICSQTLAGGRGSGSRAHHGNQSLLLFLQLPLACIIQHIPVTSLSQHCLECTVSKHHKGPRICSQMQPSLGHLSHHIMDCVKLSS